jgi:uncharacterized flavoprotein (TIGR03862 family)
MKNDVAIIGGGPAGLIAAEFLAKDGFAVTLYERKPSLGRKFLMAGRGGLNITHSEPLDQFLTRYGQTETLLSPVIKNFTPTDMREWCHELGQDTFIGSSGRVFPKSLKASPLLRAWIARLENLGVIILRHHEWMGWNDNGDLLFRTKASEQPVTKTHSATLLALGGGSWPSLGSDGTWMKYLAEKNISLAPLRSANCGFVVEWSQIFKDKFVGAPLKSLSVTHHDKTHHGEIMITQNGIEGGSIYALSSFLRDDIEQTGSTQITIDLRPEMCTDDLEQRLQNTRGKQSFSTYLKKTLNLSQASIGLLYETNRECQNMASADLAKLIKSIPLTLTKTFPIDKAISTAGGIEFKAMDKNYMLSNLPGVFVAGEMIDWEAPTGGYLLQATFATGIAAAKGISSWFKDR